MPLTSRKLVIKLVHRDSIHSPYYNKNDNVTNRIKRAIGSSILPFTYLQKKLTNYRTNNSGSSAVKQVAQKGLSVSELEKLPKVTGKELVLGTECAVCLGEIEAEQPARMVPGCNHGYHLQCADTWLSKHSLCPVCRAKQPKLLDPSQDYPF
ncbi:hypothetical protein DITRI_Ditri10aG0173400 [Diplodiscus trichospermus]